VILFAPAGKNKQFRSGDSGFLQRTRLYWFSKNRKLAFGALACFRDYEPL